MQLWRQDGLAFSKMAHTMGVQPATITCMVERMERAGLVERRKDLEDQRVSRIFLTQKGQALQEPVHDCWAELESLSLTNFTVEERILLRRFLLQLSENLAQEA